VHQRRYVSGLRKFFYWCIWRKHLKFCHWKICQTDSTQLPVHPRKSFWFYEGFSCFSSKKTSEKFVKSVLDNFRFYEGLFLFFSKKTSEKFVKSVPDNFRFTKVFLLVYIWNSVTEKFVNWSLSTSGSGSSQLPVCLNFRFTWFHKSHLH